jgi:hypothetical protein
VGLRARRILVGPLVDLDAQAAGRVGRRGACNSAVQALEGDGTGAAGKSHGVEHVHDRADLSVFVFVPRDEQHALLAGDVDRQRDGHVREDHKVLQRDEQQGPHRVFTLLSFRVSH